MPTLNEVYKCLPAAKLIDKKTINNQDTTDIVKQVLNQHILNKKDAVKIAHLFDNGDVYGTCLNVWNFLKYKVPYTVEPSSFQSTKTLSRFVYDAMHGTGKNDCKHFAGFTASILDALGYKFKYRFAGYSSVHKYPTHVYVVALNNGYEIPVDAVISGFNIEKPFTVKIDKKMSLYSLSGIDESAEMGGVFSKIKKAVKSTAKAVAKPIAKAAKAVKQGALTVGLAVPRNAFLLLVRFNVHGWATGLNKMSWERLAWWKDWAGGNRTDLMNAIKAGAKNKRIFGLNYNDYLVPESVGAIGVEPVTITAALASATPIIAKVTSLLSEAEKISNTVNNVTSTVNKTKEAVAKGNEAFKALTGKGVEDIIFKKESGKTANTSELKTQDFNEPTNEEANAIAKKLTETNKPFDNKILLIGGAALVGLVMLNKK